MKKILLTLFLVAILFSCNNDRIAELETKNNELKATIVLCQEEAKNARTLAENAIANAEQQRAIAEIATLRALEAQKLAEKQFLKAQEAAAAAKR